MVHGKCLGRRTALVRGAATSAGDPGTSVRSALQATTGAGSASGALRKGIAPTSVRQDTVSAKRLARPPRRRPQPNHQKDDGPGFDCGNANPVEAIDTGSVTCQWIRLIETNRFLFATAELVFTCLAYTVEDTFVKTLKDATSVPAVAVSALARRMDPRPTVDDHVRK
ncbi:hypothetical protein RUM43_008410 [Polyplax serrata]|uniref:Uncharacterized protein n=1 Tax=Polyplax serrata TaxID=468196 RepID=A0AAN8PNE2_POLSC